jgi:Zn-dependent protease with chaperone function
MALVGELDFDGFVAQRKAGRAGGHEDGGHAYAYASDRQMRAGFEKVKPVELAVAAAVRMFKQFGKSELLGHSVKVSERQFSRVHGLAVECAQTLGIVAPTVYIRNDPTLNAGTYGTNDDSFIMVHSALVDHLSEDELRGVIGHECGHIHNNHVVYLTALHFLTQMAGVFVQWIVAPATMALRAWSRRAEITCDRAELLCTKNIEVSQRSLAKLALGSQKLYEQLDLDVFLEQHAESQEGVGRIRELFATHPWLPKRLLAIRAFSESELYRRHAGLGEGGLTMEQVDEKVHALIKVLG